MGWTVQESNPGRREIFRAVHLLFRTMRIGSFPGEKWPVLGADHNLFLAPGCKLIGAIPLPLFCACKGMSWGDLYLYWNTYCIFYLHFFSVALGCGAGEEWGSVGPIVWNIKSVTNSQGGEKHLSPIKMRKTNWIGHNLLRNVLIKHDDTEIQVREISVFHRVVAGGLHSSGMLRSAGLYNLDCLTIEDGTCRLSLHVGSHLPPYTA